MRNFWRELLVAQLGLKIDDDAFLLQRKHSTLQSGTQVVDPTQAAAFAVSLETYEESNR
jgi:hypothetical protein